MTKLMRSWLPAVLAIMFAGIFATSCNSKNSGPQIEDDTLFDIATLVATNDNGTTVTLRKDGDSPLATLTFANVKIDTDKVAVGQRFWIAYRTATGIPYQSGPAQLIAYMAIYNSTIIEGTKESTQSWATMQQDVLSMWRTGNWINVQALCTYSADRPNKYDLVVDKTTLGNDYPEAYLLYEANTAPGANTQQFFASFNISSVWSLQNVKGLRITMFSSGGKRTLTFSKDLTEPIRPNE